MKFAARALSFAVVSTMAILIAAAVLGAVVALCGGLIGLEGVRATGGLVAGGAAIAFFSILLSPLSEVTTVVTDFSAGKSDLERADKL